MSRTFQIPSLGEKGFHARKRGKPDEKKSALRLRAPLDENFKPLPPRVAIQGSMDSSAQPYFQPAPHKTSLWLARVSIGLLIGGALWLMGVRVRENYVRVDGLQSPASKSRASQPAL